MSQPEPIVRKFVGDGTTFVSMVPARDLTQTDVEALAEEQRAAMEASGLYETTRVGARLEAAAGDDAPPVKPTKAKGGH